MPVLTGAVVGGVITNLLRGSGVGRVIVQNPTPAKTMTTAVMLHGITLLQSGACAVLTIPVGDTVVGSLSASFISVRTLPIPSSRS